MQSLRDVRELCGMRRQWDTQWHVVCQRQFKHTTIRYTVMNLKIYEDKSLYAIEKEKA